MARCSAHTGIAAGAVLLLVAAACGAPAAAPTATKAPAPQPTLAAVASPLPAATPTVARAAAPTPTPASAPAPAPTITPVARTSPKGRVVLAAADSELEAVKDPHRVSLAGGVRLWEPVHNGLVFLDDNFNVVPRLATAWTVSPDGKVWEFTIRRGVRFHDGTAMTPEDVAFSMERAMDASDTGQFIPNGFNMKKAGVVAEVVGDKVVLRSKNPYPLMLNDQGTLGRGNIGVAVLSKKQVQGLNDGVYAWDKYKDRPVGLGAFKLVKHEPATAIYLETFPDWWAGSATVREVVVKIIPEAATRVAMLYAGESDIAELVPGIEKARVEATRGMKTAVVPAAYTIWMAFFGFSNPQDPFSDRRVRLAANYAIDRQAILDRVYYGVGQIMAGPFPQGVFGYDLSIKPYPYDPAKAKQLLAEAGYPSGFKTVFRVDPRFKDYVEAAMGMLEKVGISGELVIHDSVNYFGSFDKWPPTGVGHQGGGVWRDGWFFTQTFLSCGFRVSRICVPEIQSRFEKASAEVDEKKREELLKEIYRISYETPTQIFVAVQGVVFGLGPRVESWKPLPSLVYLARYEGIRLKE